jgi:hypothetical protein
MPIPEDERKGYDALMNQMIWARSSFGPDALDQCMVCKHFRFHHRFDGRVPKSGAAPECIDCACAAFVGPTLARRD